MSHKPVLHFTIYNINVFDDRARLGSVENVILRPRLYNNPAPDPKYNEEVSRFLDEVEEEFLLGNSKIPLENYDFPEDTHHVGPIPDWYQEMLQSKIKEAKSRLEILTNLVCATSPSTTAHIKRIEEDHSTSFCKMNCPRHPPMDKPWTNYWKFCCMIDCKDSDLDHTHTAACQSLVMKNGDTIVSTTSSNICHNDYPQHVIDVLKLFQDFATETIKKKPFSDSEADVGTIYDKAMWNSLTLAVRGNQLNELMLVIHGLKIRELTLVFKEYFQRASGKKSKVTSVVCYDRTWGTKKRKAGGIILCGVLELKDQVGPIPLQYHLKKHRVPNFDSVKTMQLGKIIQDYMGLTKETTFLDFGCNLGVLSLIMSYKCDKVIAFNADTSAIMQVREAEKIKTANKIRNVSFLHCRPEDVLTSCSQYNIKQCMTVAILDLSSGYGKSEIAMRALRNIPSLWRVMIYGSFDSEFHENIALLTSDDDSMGERYLPMQGCILDRSASVANAFDIVVLFERKSLVAPKIELLAPGPTLNVEVDSETADRGSSCSPSEIASPKEKSCERSLSPPAAERTVYQPTDNQPHFSYPPEFQFNFQPPTSRRFPDPRLFSRQSSVNQDFQFYCYPPLQRFHRPPVFRYPPPPMDTYPGPPSLLSYPSMPMTENYWFNGQPPPLERFPISTFFSYPPVPARNEIFQFNRPPPPLERYPSPPPPPPPPAETSLLEKDRTLSTAESVQSNKDKNGRLNSTGHGTSKVTIESKAADPNNSADFSTEPDSETLKDDDMVMSPPDPPDISSMETPIHNPRALNGYASTRALTNVTVDEFKFPIQANQSFLSTSNCESEKKLLDTSQIKKEKNDVDSPLTTVKTTDEEVAKNTIKSEIVDPSYSASFSESVPLVTVKSEPSDSHETSPVLVKNEPADIENMETPTHHPRALSQIAPSQPLEALARVTVDGSEFPVEANLTFFDKPKRNLQDVEREPGEISDSDEEIELICEMKDKQEKGSQTIRVESKPSPLPLPPSRFSNYKPSPPPRTFARPPSPRKPRRSPSPLYSGRRRYGRSPSAKRYRRSPSPIERRRRRSPSPSTSKRSSAKREIRDRTKTPNCSRRDRHSRYRRSRSRSPR